MGWRDTCTQNFRIIFNVIFAVGSLSGLVVLIAAAVVHQRVSGYAGDIVNVLRVPAILLIVVGCIVFVIALFGCYSNIKISNRMVIISTVSLLIFVIIQMAIGIYLLSGTRLIGFYDLNAAFSELVQQYYGNDAKVTNAVDAIQQGLYCCGAVWYTDYTTIPWSCCTAYSTITCSTTTAYRPGCSIMIQDLLSTNATIVGSVAVALAGVEVIGIICALYLTNSIKNVGKICYSV